MTYSYEPRIKIDVRRDVHEELRERKTGKETFNEVIRGLLDIAEKCKGCSENCKGTTGTAGNWLGLG